MVLNRILAIATVLCLSLYLSATKYYRSIEAMNDNMAGRTMIKSKLSLICIISLFAFGSSRPGSAFVTANNEYQPLAKSRRQSQLCVPTTKPKRRRFLSLAASPREKEPPTSEVTVTTIEKPTIPSSSPDDDTTSSDLSSSRFSISEANLGLLALFTVPMIWGTYVPVVRTLYEIDPPVPGTVFSACYFAVASLSTLALVALPKFNRKDDAVPAPSSALEDTTTAEKRSSITMPVIAGLELGTYLFLGTTLQNIGLKTVPADRAGFLVQMTTILVPLVEATLGGNLFAVDGRTWGACFLALAGITIMGMDHNAAIETSSIMAGFNSLNSGDLLIMGAALMYTMHVVRLGKYAKETVPLQLAASKATVELILSIGLITVLVTAAASGESSGGLWGYAQESGRDIVTFFDTFSQGIADGTLPPSTLKKIVGATLWTGWVSTAYTIYAQSYGQRRVSPTNANLIYSVQPIFTALFAFLLLGESMAPIGFVGGGFIGAAVYTVASKPASSDSESDP